MDYEKRYKEALERAETLIEKLESTHIKGFIYHIFPELQESEDERIKRNIIAALKGEGYYDCDLTNECIVWLEKQGEQNLIEIHPIFRAGDIIRNKRIYDEVLIEQLDMNNKVYYHKSFDGAATNHSASR